MRSAILRSTAHTSESLSKLTSPVDHTLSKERKDGDEGGELDIAGSAGWSRRGLRSRESATLFRGNVGEMWGLMFLEFLLRKNSNVPPTSLRRERKRERTGKKTKKTGL